MFEAIIGHTDNKTFFARLVAQREFPHALLCYGPDGIGKRTLALAFARELLRMPGQPVNLENHPDFVQVTPDPTKKLKVISVEQMRTLGEQAAFGPAAGDHKVCLIDEVDVMNPQAANAFLKLLEEPPRGWLFLLVTARRDALLPTILSRVVQVRFYPLTPDEAAQALAAQGLAPQMGQVLARLADGSPGLALRYFAQGALQLRGQALDYLGRIPMDAPACYLQRQDYLKLDGAENGQLFTQLVEYLLRDMLFCRLGLREQLFSADLEPQLDALAQRWQPAGLQQAIAAAAEAARAFARHASLKPVLDILTFQLQAAYEAEA